MAVTQLPTSAVQIARFAGALYGVEVGTVTMAQINADINAVGGISAAVNGYFKATFSNAKASDVAAAILANVGLSATDPYAAALTAQITAAGATGTQGQTILALLNNFASLTSDATYGKAASAFNANVNTALTYSGADNVAFGTANAPTAFNLTTGLDNVNGPAGTIYFAPLTNNGNTWQSGDTITGTGTGNELIADIGNSQAFAIAGNTSKVQWIDINAHANSFDSTNNNTSQTNQVQIRASGMVNVTRWEDNNSRSDLLIEDVRIESTNAAGAGNNQVVLNADRTVNATATNAAGTTAWQVTSDVTIAMVSTDPGHVDMGVYFDNNSLRAGPSVASASGTLTLRLMDIKGAQAGTPLKDNIYTAFSFYLGGKLTTIPITTDGTTVAAGGKAVNGTSTYANLVTAINAGLKAQNITGVTAALGNPFQATDSLTNAPVTGTLITLTSTTATLSTTSTSDATGALAGFLTTQPTPSTSNYVTTVTATSNTATAVPLVTSNIVLDDVGRGAMGGNLVVGNLATGDTSNTKGVDQFNIHVDRTSIMEAITSTNNALRVVLIDNQNNISNATGIHNGNLTVTGQVTTGKNASANMANSIATPVTTSGVDQPLPGMVEPVYATTGTGGSQFNQYGFNDVQTIDASKMTGSITFTAAMTQASINKYMNLTDGAPNVANADNVPVNYTGTAQNDTITVALDPLVTATQTNNLGGREDFVMTIDGGAGNDTITVGVYSVKDANGRYAAAGNTDAWYGNQKLNANINVFGGAGNDTIRTPGAGDKNITAAAGADTIYTDNTGLQVVSNPSNTAVTLTGTTTNATWLLNTADQNTALAAARNINNLSSAKNNTYNLYLGTLQVTFDGDKSITVAIPTTTATSYVTTDLQINQAIKTAINTDPVLSKLLKAQDGPANTLVVTSLIDGVYK